MSKDKTSGNASDTSANAEKDKNTEEKKTARYALYRTLMMAVRQVPYALLPKFPHDIQLVSDNHRNLDWFIADASKTLTEVKVDKDIHLVHTLIAQYLNTNEYFADKPDWHWLSPTVKDFCNFMQMNLPSIQPKLFKFMGERDYSYATIPFPYPTPEDAEIPTPMFDEILSRMSAPEAFASWVGSLFDLESNNTQYVWMRGDGGDSKGALNGLLHYLFANVYFSQSLPEGIGRFWSKGVVGKRVVVFPDTDALDIPSQGVFKNMTGDEPVHGETKGGSQWNDNDFTPKFMFLSQHKPRLNYDNADRRRIIYIEIQKINGQHDLGFKEKLYCEARGIIAKCIQAFDDTKKYDGGVIQAKNEELWENRHIINEDFEVLLSDYFDFDDDSNVPVSIVSRIIEKHFKDRRTATEFRQYMQKCGCRSGTVKKPDGTTYRAWKGLRQKPAYERNRT